MARPRRKTPDELMQEAFWSLYDICRLFRKGPKTIMRYVNHPDPRKRLPGYLINGEFCAEKTKVLAYFKYGPKKERTDDSEPLEESRFAANGRVEPMKRGPIPHSQNEQVL